MNITVFSEKIDCDIVISADSTTTHTYASDWDDWMNQPCSGAWNNWVWENTYWDNCNSVQNDS